jgi:hypothetical protein
MAPDGLVAIDWTNGARGTPMTDFARTWLLFRLMTETNPESMTQIDTFWQTYSSRYRELSSCPEDELVNWQIVQAAASLFQDRQSYDSMPAVIETRIDFVHAMLGGGTHRWKT